MTPTPPTRGDAPAPGAAPDPRIPRIPRVACVARVAVAALLAFAACAIAMAAGATARFDDLGLRWLHVHATPSLEAAARWLAHAGYGRGVLPFDALLVLALLVLRRRRDAAFATVALGGGLLLNKALKLAFARPRPVLDWPVGAVPASFAFPSGHAMATATLATTLTLLAWPSRRRWPVVAIAWGFALLVGVSRVQLGAHYPSDVIAGWAMGVAWPALSWTASRSAQPAHRAAPPV